jgi:DNA modification methylase
MPSDDSIFKLHNRDVRKVQEILESYGCHKKFVDTTITSPPYYNVKTYGYKNQIGHGQKYSEYLDDLEEIFEQIHFVTNDTGSLWIIVDTFGKDGKLVNLPFEMAERIKHCGWNFTDILIWKKDKTLPWSKKGQLRNIFEYVLFFTKSDHYKFYDDRIRIFEFSELKQWWTRFPERYNPEGTLPTNVWEYPIPTQGIWGKKSFRHFNPLPPKMIERILLLTTDDGDVVLDPFAGSGTVLSVADFMHRRWFGFEMNKVYCDMFEKYVLKETKEEMLIEKKRDDELEVLRKQFKETIKNLRLAKFPKSLIRESYRRKVLDIEKDSINAVFAISREPTKDELSKMPDNKFMVENIFLVFNDDVKSEFVQKQIEEIASKAPLSKFGIDPRIFVVNKNEFVLKHGHTFEDFSFALYAYGVVNEFEKEIAFSQWLCESEKPEWRKYHKNGVPPIISNVKVNQKTPKTWKSAEERFRIEMNKFEEIGI